MTFVQIAVGVLTVIALLVMGASVREFFYLRHLRRQAPDDDLWLLDAIRVTSGYLTFTAVYFVVLTVAATFWGNLSELFPPMRILTALVLLGVIGLPVYLGREMRRRRNGHKSGWRPRAPG